MKNKNKYIVLKYEHIDYYNYIPDPKMFFSSDEEYEEELINVKSYFVESGWEGDGEIGLIWLPPFLDEAKDSALGDLVWHVKQDNNGTSFLAFREIIQSAKLLDQNQTYIDDGREMMPVHETYSEEKCLKNDLDNLQLRIQEIKQINDSNVMSKELYQLTLGCIQNELISDFNYFIDECYLEFLQHVLTLNNPSNLKLRTIKSKVNLTGISSTADNMPMDYWLTIQQIISSIWRDFKFMPFKDKFKEITSCVDFKVKQDIKDEINKHIVIRNCIQHHNWELVRDVLNTIGKKEIIIIQDNGESKAYKMWQKVELTYPEVESIINILDEFLTDYSIHVKGRVKSRTFIKV